MDEDTVSGTQSTVGTVSVLDPGEIAELRAQGMAALLEQQWLSDPVNVAKLRAEERARILEQAFAGGS